MQNHNLRFKTCLILIFALAFCAFSFKLFAFYVPTWFFVEESENPAKPNVTTAPVAGNGTAIVEQLCTSIYKGDFAAARQLLGQQDELKSTPVAQLANIISEYEAIEQHRLAAQKTAYEEQLAEVAKFQADADTNDVNDIAKAFSVIAKASEFADAAQRVELLSKPFVKQVIQKAAEGATEFESKGKWLDAYITCYSWLVAIDPKNEAYSDYAEQLLEKAGIVASFQDSPCETRKERFKNVKKEMFVRAIDTLSSNYVSVIDYRQMATKGIRRCEFLADVVKFPIANFPAPGGSVDNRDAQLSAWSAALSALLDEVKQSPTGLDKDEFIEVVDKVLAINTTTIELPESVLIAQFAEAALSALDPYTVMVWPRQVQDFEQMMTNEFTGIGIEISKPKGLLTVSSLLLDTPAFNCGVIDAGDVIAAVDGVETKDMTLMCAVKNIKGPAGMKVKLKIRRPSKDKDVEDKEFDVILTRAKITVPTIRGWQRTKAGKWLHIIDDENKIAYVRITSFSEKTSGDLEKVLTGLEAEGLKGLVLDLRFNSGGLLNSATAVVDKFIKEGLIVSTRPRQGIWTYAEAHGKKTHPDYPLVMLINSSSASASEIVAGALADEEHKRAVLVGERTHGKGSVQGITPHPGGGAQLKYTMAYYHLPSGQRVESQHAMKKEGRKDWGIGPNIEVKLRNDELRKMINVQRDNDVLVMAGATAPKKHTVEETLAADPQLAVGVLAVKSKLIQENLSLVVGSS